MAETLGSLCDKLTIVKLKQWHSEDATRLQSLSLQEQQLKEEIEGFVAAAMSGLIKLQHLTFAANKVYKKEGNEVAEIIGSMGDVISQLADVNCKLWHEQEKVYDFENVSAEQKNVVVKNLAILNLERNKCIDAIDRRFQAHVKDRLESCQA